MRIGRQELPHLTRVGQLDVGRDVRDEEPVLAHHLRKEHAGILADPVAEQMVVERFLRVARPSHEPAHVARRERVGVLGPEIARWVERAVGDHHLDGHARARDRRVELVRELHADAGAAR